MTINFINSYNNSYKDLYNQKLSNKLASTTARLAAELDILRNRDIDLEIKNITTQNKEDEAATLQSDFISQSIKDIIDIRERLGITQAAGSNLPLEELFQTHKNGSLLDTKS